MKKAFQLLIVPTVIFSSLVHSCKEDVKTAQPITVEFKNEGSLSFFKTDSDSLLRKFNIEIAESDYEIQRGLMDRYSMKDNQGMLFAFPNEQPRSFYMKSTYIPLDLIFINAQKKVVSIQKNAKPLDETSLLSNFPAKFVFEINAGLSEKLNIEVGDYMDYSELNN